MLHQSLRVTVAEAVTKGRPAPLTSQVRHRHTRLRQSGWRRLVTPTSYNGMADPTADPAGRRRRARANRAAGSRRLPGKRSRLAW